MGKQKLVPGQARWMQKRVMSHQGREAHTSTFQRCRGDNNSQACQQSFTRDRAAMMSQSGKRSFWRERSTCRMTSPGSSAENGGQPRGLSTTRSAKSPRRHPENSHSVLPRKLGQPIPHIKPSSPMPTGPPETRNRTLFISDSKKCVWRRPECYFSRCGLSPKETFHGRKKGTRVTFRGLIVAHALNPPGFVLPRGNSICVRHVDQNAR